MARKEGGPRDLVVEILRDIRKELQALNGRVDGLSGRVDDLAHETAKGFADLSMRFDNLLEFSGDRYRDHEKRIHRIEKRLGMPRVVK
ncbi:MAG: hypothetical protein HY904_16960 [Deltaproteobacteria bacterium]|nr:hypothetical protein [Deltaproteobacteria bacterium]